MKNNDQLDLFRYHPTYHPEIAEFVNYWNERIWLPNLQKSDRQLKMIRDAFQRDFFRRNWKLAIANVAKSNWLRSKMKRKFQLDFFLIPDNFDKIVEGFYSDEEKLDVKVEPWLQQKFDKNGQEIL